MIMLCTKIYVLYNQTGGVYLKYERLANDIITRVGGKENINSLQHCMTRLRFDLNDDSLAGMKRNEGSNFKNIYYIKSML